MARRDAPIVRSVCVFAREPSARALDHASEIAQRLMDLGCAVQTRRLCCPIPDPGALSRAIGDPDPDLLLGTGSLTFAQAVDVRHVLGTAERVSANVDLTGESIAEEHARYVLDLARHAPSATFRFAYIFNTPASSPFFPSATYTRDGFAIGLQTTDLAATCDSIDAWLERLRAGWRLVDELFSGEPSYLGLDSSIAPMGDGDGSLVAFVERLGLAFDRSATTDTYLKITDLIRRETPHPVGLCGLMFPCLEDFRLAAAYERGEFSIERNLFLSLHSGLGIDTYPIGIDESPTRIAEILQLVQGLAHKYNKPLSVRFVSDGRARVGETTDFGNRYLKDVVIRPL